MKFSLRIKRLTLGYKLIGLIAILLLVSISLLTFFSVRLFQKDNILLVQQLSYHEAKSLSSETREIFKGYVQKMQGQSKDSKNKEKNLKLHAFFEVEKSSQGINILSTHIIPSFQYYFEKNKEDLRSFLISPNFGINLEKLFSGQEQVGLIKGTKSHNGLMIIALPNIPNSPSTRARLGVFKTEELFQSFKKSEGVSTYLVDQNGFLITHSDKKLSEINTLAPLSNMKELLATEIPNKQFQYTDTETEEERLAAFRKIGFAGMGVVAEVPVLIALESSRKVIKMSSWLAFILFCSAMLCGSLFSGYLVAPILRLKDAAEEVAKGKLETSVNVAKSGGDELSDLARAFNQMTVGLQEKEKFHEVFIKYHGTQVTDKILSGEVKLGGEKVSSIVLFTDLRGFTTFSEGLSPEEVVLMLNDYMGRMVKIIQNRGGVIDKFIGDSIMATWGVPFLEEDDAFNAVMACLEMREELQLMNKERKERELDPIAAGMGLNFGESIAGNIGSDQRMEYTIIGDTVNIAARLESMTKELKTDFLISQSVQELLSDRFVFEAGGNIKLKGKNVEISVYKVKGSTPKKPTKEPKLYNM